MIDEQRNQRKNVAAVFALHPALEDALSDLVQVHGLEYLDAFLERRIRRNVEDMKRFADHIPGPMGDMQRDTAADMEEALRRVVDAVRANPTPAPR